MKCQPLTHASSIFFAAGATQKNGAKRQPLAVIVKRHCIE